MELPDPWTQPLLTVREAAACLGISERTARRQISQLDLATVDLGGWRRISTRYVYETLGEPLPPRPGAYQITLADLDEASRGWPGPPS
jgi:excisionase family DNA binding protein